MYMHLTNVAIQKHGETYNDKHGNKWPLRSLELYIEGTQGTETCRRLFSDIDCVIINSLKACQSIMINDRHCFELYGEALVNPVAEKEVLLLLQPHPEGSSATHVPRPPVDEADDCPQDSTSSSTAT